MKTYQVVSSKRLTNTTNGNPRYEFVLQDEAGNAVTARTKGDSSFVYGLTGNEERLFVTMHETKRGMVITNADRA